jgi:hypothetical protein
MRKILERFLFPKKASCITDLLHMESVLRTNKNVGVVYVSPSLVSLYSAYCIYSVSEVSDNE